MKKILSNKTKELMHIVMNGNMSLVPVMHQLSHYRDIDKFLTWLDRNHIVGNNLTEWLQQNHQNSVLNMVKFIVSRHNKGIQNNELILGKDWIK